MRPTGLVPGSIVISQAGRDRGRTFVVIEEIDRDFVMICNGSLRSMDRMKKKRRRHLKATGEMMTLPEGRPPMDHEIRGALSAASVRGGEKLVQV